MLARLVDRRSETVEANVDKRLLNTMEIVTMLALVSFAISYDGDQYNIQYTSLQRLSYTMEIVTMLAIPYDGNRLTVSCSSIQCCSCSSYNIIR